MQNIQYKKNIVLTPSVTKQVSILPILSYVSNIQDNFKSCSSPILAVECLIFLFFYCHTKALLPQIQNNFGNL